MIEPINAPSSKKGANMLPGASVPFAPPPFLIHRLSRSSTFAPANAPFGKVSSASYPPYFKVVISSSISIFLPF